MIVNVDVALAVRLADFGRIHMREPVVSNRNPVKYANCSPGPSTNPANPRREHNSCARRNLLEYVDTETESLMVLS